MHTIPEIDEIAKRATERIAKEFAESGFANPPVVTHGIARAVLEAAEQVQALDAAKSAANFPTIDKLLNSEWVALSNTRRK